MIRWWENLSDEGLDERPEAAKSEDEQPAEKAEKAQSYAREGMQRSWTFRVRAETSRGEVVCVTGRASSLGQWMHNRPLILNNEMGEHSHQLENIWSGNTSIPADRDVEYRYCICVTVEPDSAKIIGKQYIIRRWETNLKPRIIRRNAKLHLTDEPETFGYYDGTEKVERGWLTRETAIQLKLFGNPIQIWKPKLQHKKIYVKVTPVYLTKAETAKESTVVGEELSLETMDLADKHDTPLTEIAVMNEHDREFKYQQQFGRHYEHGDFMIFQILVHSPETVAYLIDFYAYKSHVTEGEPPYHVGFSYLLPSAMNLSEGHIVAPITSVQHRPIGQIKVEYLVVKPILNSMCDLKSSMQRQWKESWQGLEVGHRGAGSSFKTEIKQCSSVRENTIASLKTAASFGADFVEFDVQLSRDLVPVLYHDFHVAISMRHKKHIGASEMLHVPVKELTLQQLHLLKAIKDDSPRLSKVYIFEDFASLLDGVYHVEEGRSMHDLRFEEHEENEEHQPFPTLQLALEVLDPSVGFNVEIKWTMKLEDGTFELSHPFDLNLYLDIVIQVVLQYAGGRNIVFSCFHPDICAMIRLKQNRYPVMFLTQGSSAKFAPYHDPRCQNILMAVHFAINMDILGINTHSEELLNDASMVQLVKESGLVLFCWGDMNNDKENIKQLKTLGLHAIIYDRIDELGSKDESVFRLEARTQSDTIMFKAAAEKAQEEVPASAGLIPMDNYFLDLNAARRAASTISLSSTTSLWSQLEESSVEISPAISETSKRNH